MQWCWMLESLKPPGITRNHPEKFDGLHYNQQKRIKFYRLGIICCILHQECMKMRVEKVNIYKDIEL